MAHRNWLHNVAIGIGVILAILLALAFGELVKGRSSIANPQPARNAGETALINQEYQPDCGQEKNADLCVQLRMANAAEQQAFYTAAGFVFLALTLFAAMWAAFEARRAAVAARESVDMERQHLDRLERPYVFVEIEESGIQVLSGGQFRFGGVRFEYACVNYGRSVAHLTEIHTDWPILAISEMPDVVDPDRAEGWKFPIGIVSFGDKKYREQESLLLRCEPKMLTGDAWKKYRMFFIGYIKYTDVLGGRYVTGFCACFDPIADRWILFGNENYNYQKIEKEPLKR